MLGLLYGGRHVYRMCSVRVERDVDNPLDVVGHDVVVTDQG